jgi:phosphatidate cytidylyltransferase
VTRVLSGTALLLLVLGAVWLVPPLAFLAIAELLLLLALVEYRQLAAASGLDLPVAPCYAAAMLMCLVFAQVPFGRDALAAPAIDLVLVTAIVALGVLTMSQWHGDRDALARVGVAVFPSLYLGLPIGTIVSIRESRGAAALLLLMLTVIVSDTAQYYTGRLMGRRPLAPEVSPKKTIEGAVGGFLFGGAFFVIAGAWWLPGVPIGLRALLAMAVVALGIAGDLFESMLRRSAGVKDSSSLIPGHGGVLDRVDALLFAAPVYYLVLKYV